MSGREETAEPVGDAVPAIPPHFGEGASVPPEPEASEPEASEPRASEPRASGPGAPARPLTDRLDGPKAPWWAVPPGSSDIAPAGDEQARAEAQPPPGTLVAGPGMAALDTRGALPPRPRAGPAGRAEPASARPEGPGEVTAPMPAVRAEAPLTPDAILPPGPRPGGPAPMSAPAFPTAAGPAAMGPFHHGGGTAPFPPSTGGADGRNRTGGHGGAPGPIGASRPAGSRGRRILLLGGAAVGAVTVGALIFTGVGTIVGPAAQKKSVARHSPSGHGGQAAGPTPSALPPGRMPEPSIDSELTDHRPLSLSELFPTTRIMLAGRPYRQDKTSVNHRCDLAARGAMASALKRGGCRAVVRATFVDGTRYAVTTGVAAMPSRAAAVSASRAGDPSRYEWFRGMRGRIATNMDQAGGYASSTVRGRYIIYSYAQYADGTRPRPADPALKDLTRQFIEYAVRPIEERGR